MKISIITVCFNSQDYISTTIDSVLSQSYPNVEYIIVDGNSTDGTLEIINSYGDKISKWISEPDSGIYDAMNKGIRMATGDIVGIVNSDDFFHRKDSLEIVVEAFKENKVESVFADIIFVKRDNPEKLVRYFSSANFSPWKMRFGFMPAHPTFFTFKTTYEKYGFYKTNFKIAADFELLLRFLFKYKITYKYIPVDLMKMRIGGVSTRSLNSTFIINIENLKAFKMNGFYSNYMFLFSRYFVKVFHYLPFFVNYKSKNQPQRNI
jgi:glycosyltransferase involved in cell wall biosynthesis